MLNVLSTPDIFIRHICQLGFLYWCWRTREFYAFIWN